MQVYRKQRNYGCRIHDAYTYFGMRTVVLENELVRISILADKGTEVFEYVYKPRDLDLIWLSENGVQNPNAYLPTSPDPVSTFVDYYPGGWQEVFPNGGPTSASLGAQYGQHGEVAHMPWDYCITTDKPERVEVQFQVRLKKAPFVLAKKLSLESGSATLQIEEIVENESDVPLPYMWGHHLAYGKPFLKEGCIVRLPEGIRVRTELADSSGELLGRIVRGPEYVWPFAEDELGDRVDLSVLPPEGTRSEIVYLHGFGKDAWYQVENPDINMGMKVEWDGETLPYLWFWQEFGATKEYPWYGRHYNIGLEPFAGYPTHGLEEAVKNGSAGTLGPRSRKALRLKTTPYLFPTST